MDAQPGQCGQPRSLRLVRHDKRLLGVDTVRPALSAGRPSATASAVEAARAGRPPPLAPADPAGAGDIYELSVLSGPSGRVSRISRRVFLFSRSQAGLTRSTGEPERPTGHPGREGRRIASRRRR